MDEAVTCKCEQVFVSAVVTVAALEIAIRGNRIPRDTQPNDTWVTMPQILGTTVGEKQR